MYQNFIFSDLLKAFSSIRNLAWISGYQISYMFRDPLNLFTSKSFSLGLLFRIRRLSIMMVLSVESSV
jgi:hypothetical protein